MEAGIRPVTGEKAGELLLGGREHVAVAVALVDIAGVEAVDFPGVARRFLADRQIAVALDQPAVTTAGPEIRHPHPGRDAGLAALAVRPVEVIAAAAEPEARQFAVEPGIQGRLRIDEQRGRLPALQITAGVGGGAEKTQFGQIAHGVILAQRRPPGIPLRRWRV